MVSLSSYHAHILRPKFLGVSSWVAGGTGVKLRLFTIYQKEKSRNFGQNINGMFILSPQTEIFSGKLDFLKGRPKFLNVIPNGKCAFQLLVFTSNCQQPGLLTCIAFDPIFQEKIVEMERALRAHPRGNLHSGVDASHLLQLSIPFFSK